MNKILNKIEKIEKLYHGKGCTTEQIEKAEGELGIKFPEDYIDILQKYGAISFKRTEWTGLNVDDFIDVVKCTKAERSHYDNFPKKMFVLENLGIEGILTLCDEMGVVYSWENKKVKQIAQTMSAYLDECLKR
jgi:hypothetical protein